MLPTRPCMKSFRADQKGLAAVILAIAAPAALTLVGAGVDYGRAIKARAQLQSAADSAALTGASSLRLGNATPTTVASVADMQGRSAAPSSASNVSVTTDVTATDVEVNMAADVPLTFSRIFRLDPIHIAAHARARMVGTVPTCVIVLDPSSANAYDMDQAMLTGKGWAVYSNSTAADSIALSNAAKINAALTCSSGGTSINGGASFEPAAMTDCPAKPDPLAKRTAPPVGACTANKLKVGVSTTLIPGTYCGGLEIGKDAVATLQPGTYVIKDGPLIVNDSATLSGKDVSFYLTGNGAVLNVAGQAVLDLAAPALGDMAGILVFEDRAAKLGQTHKLYSRNAPNLLGTVYLSRGDLEVGAKGGLSASSAGMAQVSAWTVIIARQFSVNDQISLVLNTNYSATPVQPPEGIAPAPVIRMVQ